MNPEQAKELGRRLRTRREELGLSVRDLERLADVDNGTIVRIEQGAFAAPRPDKLSRIAEALRLSLADVFALAEYVVPGDLPAFTPYLRAKYRSLPPKAVSDLERYFDKLAARYGIDPAGPAPGQDEASGQQRRKR
jgi:transcriptional regulator with XRE-family HTH domain